jgi:pimeloyl-ACP methyl ester carboxylesterase
VILTGVNAVHRGHRNAAQDVAMVRDLDSIELTIHGRLHSKRPATPRPLSSPMTATVRQPNAVPLVLACLCLLGELFLFGSTTIAVAGEVRLKNGIVLEGKPGKLISLTVAGSRRNTPTTTYPIILVDDAWKRYYVPIRQVADDGVNLNVSTGTREEFTLPQKRAARPLTVQTVGAVGQTDPFDQFGRRTVTLATPKGPLSVVQGITKLTPEHALLQGISHQWELGIGLNQIGPDAVMTMLRNPIVTQADRPADRLAIVRFLVQAEWYELAFTELAGVEQDFPELKDKTAAARENLLQLFGEHILRELEQRRQSGQFAIAERSAQKLSPDWLGGRVQQDVGRLVRTLQQQRADLERVPAALGELESQIQVAEQVASLRTMRSAMMQELDLAGLRRLQPFLLTVNDPLVPVAEKLAMAYSGWVLGPDQAINQLPAAIAAWEARMLMLEYLRADVFEDRASILQQLRELEGVGPQLVMQLFAELPPVYNLVDATPVVSDDGDPPSQVEFVVDVPQVSDEAPVRYLVSLPPEFSANHRYPCLFLLRGPKSSAVSAARFWTGDPDQSGWTRRKGYIVVVPDYVSDDQPDALYSLEAQRAILTALRDARLRLPIDPNRVFLVGQHLGGDVAFDAGFFHPDEFAGVISLGGVCEHFGRFVFENGKATSWYIVRGELGRDLANATDNRSGMNAILDRMFLHGARTDLVYCEYRGRGLDRFPEELPSLFEWMALQERGPWPRQIEHKVLRETDGAVFWLDCQDLLRTFAISPKAEALQPLEPLPLQADITSGNLIALRLPGRRTRLRLNASLIDFDREVTVRVAGQKKFTGFLTADIQTMLEDFRQHGDRSRVAAVWLSVD